MTGAFELGQKVTITETKVTGEIRGIWFELGSPVQYHVQSFDTNKRPYLHWFLEKDLSA
jgi:hypothetical protein